MTDERLDMRLREFTIPWENRHLDLATRVNRTSIRYGNEARKKASVSVQFGAWATEMGFQVDVSDETGKRFVGNDWWSFLANSRFTVGRPSGASRITRSVRDILYEKAILSVYSSDSFEEQLARFNRRATEVSPMLAESPRYLESSGLLVAQILEGEDQPIGMLPWEHFVPLNSDWSNLSEIGKFMSSTEGLNLATRCREYVFGAKPLRSEFWYGSMAEHFSLTPLPVGEFGKLSISAAEIARRAAINELVESGMEFGVKFRPKVLRRFLRTTESPATALLYLWKSVGVDVL